MELQGINVKAYTEHPDGLYTPGLLSINGWHAYGPSMVLMFLEAVRVQTRYIHE
jgi:hypothetical protein